MSRKDIAIIDFDDAALKRVVIDAIKAAKGLHWFTLTRCRNQRSLAQNAWYWACHIPHTVAALSEAWGETVTADEAHLFLRGRFLSRPIVNRETGEEVGAVPLSTTALDTKEFSEYLDRVALWLAETFGVVVPPADTYRGMEVGNGDSVRD